MIVLLKSQVGSFASREAVTAFELANPQRVMGGLFFQFDALGNVAFIVQANSTARTRDTRAQ